MASAAAKLAAVTAVQEPKDINWKIDLTLTTYNFQGHAEYHWDISENVTDIRVMPDTTKASTVEIDLDDSDYVLLEHPLFAHWAFDIEDVSLSSAKKFKTSRLSNSTNNQYLGDNSNLEWVLGQRPIDFTVGWVVFRLCGLTTQDTLLTLIFEDRAASFLRDKTGFKTVHRGTYTRAGFVALLCREAGVDYWIPELHEDQPVSTTTDSLTPGQKRLVTGKGVNTNQNLTAKGQALTQSQCNVANALLDVGTSYKNVPSLALEAVIAAGILESTLSEDPGNGSYRGALAGSVSIFSAQDTIPEAHAFFQGGKGYRSAIQAAGGFTDPTLLAAYVEGAGTQYTAETGYAGVAAEAKAIVQAYGASTTTGSSKTLTTPGPYAFTRGPNEDSYDCIQRLASEVAWYAFMRQNRLWFVSGNYLFQQDPQMICERGKSGIDTIDPNLDMGARDSIAQCTITGRTDLWAALPGMIVQINKRGPATGKWFVSSLTTHPLDLSQQVQVIVQKPVPKRAEPASTGSIRGNVTGTPTGSFIGLVSPFTKRYRATVGVNTDAGVDFGMEQGISIGDPILAIGDCTLETIVDFSDGGYQPGMFFKFVTPVGKYWGWYVAEQITPQVSQASGVITAGTVVARFAASGTGIEIGWAAGPGQTATSVFHPGELATRHNGAGTTDGNNFYQFLVESGAVTGPSTNALLNPGHP